ncbi:unnamed protein product [Meloidogyne enterolobii]|uniref:Uncharacterized protein n=2 Tax=Meloidogyne enterolobii TaxID=390850 RepID=A0ACB0XYC1_MELEN|nr:unnamed protein product [Meloidogyne enterolobii]
MNINQLILLIFYFSIIILNNILVVKSKSILTKIGEIFTKHHCDDKNKENEATKGPQYISYGALLADAIPGRIYSKVLPLANNYTDPRELSKTTSSPNQNSDYRAKFPKEFKLLNPTTKKVEKLQKK